jgi:N-acetylmuramoyl-L-alanine amidase
LRSSAQDNQLRIVLDLKKFALAKSFQLPPNEKYGHRLVIDLFAEEEEQQLNLPELDETGGVPRSVVIAIDAGHGGEDPGSIGPAGTFEKHVALSVAKKLADKINQVHGMKAVLIREGDYFISLRDRIRKARQHKADLFVSIHADSFKDSRVSGSSVYVLSQRGASSEHARWLAEQENASDLVGGVKLDDKDNILASVLLDLSQTASLEVSIDVAERVLGGLQRVGKLHKQRVESAAFAVLKSPDIPSLLIETAYISNPAEEKKLLSAVFQDKLTDAILHGLEGYFRIHAPDNSIMAVNRVQEHVIGRGDTLSQIAQRYRISLERLRQANNLQSDRIRVGQKLTIPSTGS